jgi:hypothetical protein
VHADPLVGLGDGRDQRLRLEQLAAKRPEGERPSPCRRSRKARRASAATLQARRSRRDAANARASNRSFVRSQKPPRLRRRRRGGRRRPNHPSSEG